MDARQYKKFNEEVSKLRKHYPQCFIDVWTPEDFEAVAERALTKDQCVNIVNKLEDSFDAETGINLDTIRYAL